MLWNGYNQGKGQISILNKLEEESNDLRNQYMNFIDDFGNIKIHDKKIIDHLEINPGFSLWWMTLVAEKSIEKTKAPLHCLRLLTVKKIFNEIEPDSVELFTNNKKHPPWGPGPDIRAGKDGDWHNGLSIFVLTQNLQSFNSFFSFPVN